MIPEYSVIFPVLNQADHIEKVTLSYRDILLKHKFSFELIAVVNGTTDNSFEILKTLEKKYPEIKAYELQGRGFGLGILYGLKKSKGKYLCYLNCARITSQQLLTSLLFFTKNQTKIVHGVRTSRENINRSIGSKTYNFICHYIFNIRNTDVNGNPKIFSRQVYDKLDLQFSDSMIDLELLEKAKKLDITVLELPIEKYVRHGGKSTTSFWTVFRLLKELTFYWFQTRF
ncbi:hypothetical protein A3J15_03905 [Candidatus Roizmanbacteria bacterium RIFCSPLOWO2_02_FULL_38_10]|uniref:Glycosyltransferase 2-like domain-containing protein n=1 Tax=Candidatus Roizmanbacteria bacterium RIFCSPLOWO2_02_FULL_38_10 TaxID=1802074 RepID=A0A1F7JM64_9BACT|nr:MAG: hypothetical protein A3J15_03905 [Candidatus Roizmanbacteria bacterium RIFCSPLOWO2_02_FULL_38_10]